IPAMLELAQTTRMSEEHLLQYYVLLSLVALLLAGLMAGLGVTIWARRFKPPTANSDRSPKDKGLPRDPWEESARRLDDQPDEDRP
ncbi:MAG: hypothetical protein IT440_10595, partial [Phycisphaeraceae bacterium]|nr:hypothetical protein [Phycisphaeraceae bacterium]